ncbi:zinc finger protein ZAT18-like [Lolium rigidum]|uniref:zinc finger protein ZAT18-like n=1 Tax=Lolium rigidum TaxID=89674 RepID=UPI001F5D6724|nr:zinc finger protein ZAT18-like [Lolium rigidum]
MEAARGNDTRSSTATLLQLLLTLSSPAAASRAIDKNKRVRLPAERGGEFKCRTCGRRFATFQALGGHRTSHKRPRVRAHGLDLLLGARPGKARGPVAHRCGTCGQTFPTGQALGGHMRRHRPLSSVGAAAAASSKWTEADTSSSSTSDLSFQPDEDAFPTFFEFI